MEFHGQVESVLHPQLHWDRRTGFSKVVRAAGDYNVLATEFQKTVTNQQDISTGLFTVDVSQPDEEGHAQYEATYTTELTFQWTLTSNLIENSIYLGNTQNTWPTYLVGPSAYSFITSGNGTYEVQTANYSRIIQGLETAVRKGMTYEDLITTSWNTGSASGPYALYGYDIQASASVGVFRQSYTQYDPDHQNYIKDLFSVRMRDIDTYPVQQVVLRRVALINIYDGVDLYQDLVDQMWSKTAIKMGFGGAQSPIPTVLDNNLPETYWLFAGNQTETVTSGKLQITSEWWYNPQYETKIYGTYIDTV